jgi:hypothetical protein
MPQLATTVRTNDATSLSSSAAGAYGYCLRKVGLDDASCQSEIGWNFLPFASY